VQGTFREHFAPLGPFAQSPGGWRVAGSHSYSGNIQGTFREHSGNIQGTFREHSSNVQGTFREHFAPLGPFAQSPGGWRVAGSHSYSGNIQGTFREHSSNVEGTFREHFAPLGPFAQSPGGWRVAGSHSRSHRRRDMPTLYSRTPRPPSNGTLMAHSGTSGNVQGKKHPLPKLWFHTFFWCACYSVLGC
jgi:hypothetical protein